VTRTRIGVKPGVGPVIKVMVNDADDPWETDNTDWTKFRFNSEVDQLPYARLVKAYEHTYTAKSNTSIYFPAGSDLSDCEAIFDLPSSGGLEGLFFASARYWNFFTDPNKFHFVRVSVGGAFDTLLSELHGNYSGGDWGQIVTSNLPQDGPFLPAKSDADIWLLLNQVETYFSSVFAYGANSNNPVNMIRSQHEFTNAELSSGLTFRVAFYEIDLPVDDSPYPAVVGTPAPGKKILKFAPGIARLAKPGYDVETATDDQMIFSETKVPLAIIKTGVVTVAAGAQENIELGQAIDPAALIDYQVNQTGEALYLPPFVGFKQVTQVQHRISGTQLQFKNNSVMSLDFRFFVMAKDSLGQTSGSAKVLECSPEGLIIRKPSTGGTNFDDVIYNSEWAYMPIVDQGWVPYSSFVNDSAGGLARKRYTVSLTNDGTWKPYVMAKLARHGKSGSAGNAGNLNWSDWTLYKDFMTRQMGFVSHHGADSNFFAKVQDDQVDFYCGDGTDYEGAYSQVALQFEYLNTVGLRYYIFAVPNSL
jgi:hypothetical protein